MFLAVDFDGVIHDFRNPVSGRKMGPPMAGALESIMRLLIKHDIVVFTVKPAQPVEAWLQYWGFPKLRVTNVKEDFDLIVDDKAVAFTDWDSFASP